MRRSVTGTSFKRFNRWRRQRRIQNAATLGLVILGPLLAVLTYSVLGPLDRGASDPALRLILLADLVYMLVVAALVMQRIARMISARRNKSAGSRLHLRLTGTFALLALIPTVLVAVFSVLTINVALEGWFSDRVQNVLGASVDAAEAYQREHREDVTRDGTELANYLNRERTLNRFMSNAEVRQALERVGTQIEGDLTESFVIDEGGALFVRGPGSYEFDFEMPSAEDFETARTEGIALIQDYSVDEFRALIPLSATAFGDERFLYVTRQVDGEILALLDDTQQTKALYDQLEEDRGQILFEFGLLYLGFAMILILAAIWLGLWFAERLARPVGRLVSASQRVGGGDLSVRVIEEEGDDEISQLGFNFNRMTAQLNAQRNELLQNTQQIEGRRRLFDSVLTSVTSGVVGLDEQGNVTFANRSARGLLKIQDALEGTALPVAVPEFGALFERLISEQRGAVDEQISLVRKGQQESLLVRMSPRLNEDGVLEGYVVAFDDVTNLVSAQRMAAWGDVARRIAHEIKNPLTPIQLSAERIKRKFSDKVGEEGEALDQMTNVIIRQTGDLRRIVDEFSKFARMPEPERSVIDLAEVLRDAVTLQEAGQPNVNIVSDIPKVAVMADVDSTMISQALTNLIKNAGEAIESLEEKGAPDEFKPEVRVSMEQTPLETVIRIQDNGIGLPQDRTRLFEPYVTTRDKGTGLGLPIVKKIIEEHGGTLSLQDAEQFDGTAHIGAQAVITLPALASDAGVKTRAAE